MESLSSLRKRFVAQVAKPDVDSCTGSPPVISNRAEDHRQHPRSTVGTMTDIPATETCSTQPSASRTVRARASPREPHGSQILEAVLALPEGRRIELRAPVFKQYGEELDFVLTEVRKKGCRLLIVERQARGYLAQVELDESKIKHMDAVVDRLVVRPQTREGDQGGDRRHTAVGDGLMQVHIVKGSSKAETERFYRGLCSKTHRFAMATSSPSTSCSTIRRARAAPAAGWESIKLTQPGAAGPRPAAQYLRRLLRARGLQVQPRHMGWADDVQPVQVAALLSLDTPWEKLNRNSTAFDPRRARRQKGS